MALPAPHLDDRTFQSLVDDAKRMIHQRCPEWTDHNVSDPGVTLIETFAYMVDQLLWRLNRVPDRTYIKFLELLGLRLNPPTAARVPVTFWLSAPQQEPQLVAAGTQVATPRTEAEPVVFTTVEELAIVNCSLAFVVTEVEGTQADQTGGLLASRSFHCFGAPPHKPLPGDALYVGLSEAVPSCAVTLRVDCQSEGVGVDPRYPPWMWEAWTGDRWVPCEVDRDETGGLNRPGDIVLHVPRTHRRHAVLGQAAGWLRCRVAETESWQPEYLLSPRIARLSAFTIGGTTETINAQIVSREVIGESEGVPAQRFPLRNRPVVPGDRPLEAVVEVSGGSGWEAWTQVDDFAESGPTDRHFLIEESVGEIVFGPAVRLPDGTLQHYGAVPAKGATLRIREYRTGGGRQGNVARTGISVLKSSVPFIASVVNRRAAIGGTDGEGMDNAKLRGPLLLRTRQRAVTTEDYEHLARAAAADIARVHCVPVDGGADSAVRVLLVPTAEDGEHGSLEFHQMLVPDADFERVSSYLDERRTIGARVVVQAPNYVGLTVVARIRARARANPRTLEGEALAALYSYFHPVRGGPDGDGWPFGRAVVTGEVYAVLQRLPDVDFLEEVRLYPANPIERRRDPQAERIDLGPHDLVFSWGHHVMVQAP
jgi:predicted phage baseplate assembly protein